VAPLGLAVTQRLRVGSCRRREEGSRRRSVDGEATTGLQRTMAIAWEILLASVVVSRAW
jgi:hypothetical protein